jgi:UTP-glucose-1-phosphate uridylyltransferase
MLKFTQHAKDKIAIYNVSEQEVQSGLKNAILECEDAVEKSKVIVVEVRRVLFAVVVAESVGKIITIYRTDEKTINNRRSAGRWKCS